LISGEEANSAANRQPAGGKASATGESDKIRAAIVVDAFLDSLSVSAVQRSWVIEISVDSTVPGKSENIANTVADLYIVEQLEAKYEATKVATAWLSARLSNLRGQLEVSERAVERYRNQAGMVEGRNSVTVAMQQLSEINTQLVLARSRSAEAVARLQQVERLLAKHRDVSSVGRVLSSALIQRLLEQESDLIRRRAEMSTEFGPKHPRMINVHAEIRDLRRKIGTEIDKVVLSLKNEVEVAKARESSLADTLSGIEDRMGVLNQRQVQLRALERDSEANRALYGTFLARFKEMSGQNDLQTPDARIISRASIPIVQSAPRVKLIVGLVFVFSVIIGISLVFVVEQLDTGYRSMEQIEQLTEVAALGLVPMVKTKKGDSVARLILDQPISSYAESIRNLFVGLMLSNVDRPPKIVLVTSSMPDEGKSSITLSLARTVALSGRKVVVVDCDLRRPSLHVALDLPRTPGLVELLAKRATLDEAVQKDEASGADLITAGEQVSNTIDLVSSEQLKRLLANLGQTYDLVILDSPPILAVTDARVLASAADKTIFVVRWEKTKREAVALGLRQVEMSGGSIAGVVLSKVDVRKHAGYSFADSGYYYGKNMKYYSS
jgi:capsular exopolysaccharide synthesis family protein